jgi:uncharacterized protein YbjT (DUF2867 family)
VRGILINARQDHARRKLCTSFVANSLLNKKKKVRVVGRDNTRLVAFTSRGAEAFTANVTDEKALSRASTGAEAVYAMMPPDLTNDNYRGYQSQASGAIAKALELTNATRPGPLWDCTTWKRD